MSRQLKETKNELQELRKEVGEGHNVIIEIREPLESKKIKQTLIKKRGFRNRTDRVSQTRWKRAV